jgi:putative sigma-54 modulation protein
VQINISARHGHLSTQTQSLITEKVEKIRRLFDRLTSIIVTCDLEHRESPTVEVRVVAEHAGEFVATDKAENLMAALDSAIHKIEQQLRKYKEKLTEHRAAGHRELAGELDQETE